MRLEFHGAETPSAKPGGQSAKCGRPAGHGITGRPNLFSRFLSNGSELGGERRESINWEWGGPPMELQFVAVQLAKQDSLTILGSATRDRVRVYAARSL
jgi:hypothetical protein